MTVGPSAGSRAVVPVVVPWSLLMGFSADQWVTTADGATGQILEIVVGASDRRDGSQIRRFLVPAPELVPFFKGVGAWSKQWAAALRGDGSAGVPRSKRAATAAPPRGVVLSAYLATAAWLGSQVLPGSGRRGAGSAARAPEQQRVGKAVLGLVVVVLAAGVATASFAITASGGSPHHRSAAPAAHRAPVALGNVLQASDAPKVPPLPAASSAPAPAPPSLAGSPPLQSHEIFGYAPYWTLPESAGFDVKNLTTLAYFSVDANADGSLDQTGSGWNGYESQDLANLVTRSHAAGDRVVLTVTDFDQQSLNKITSDPAAPGRLSSALIAAVTAKNLDGVNFDFEGVGSGDRVGLTSLITQVSNALHAANPHWQNTMAVYASAASDSAGFYNVAALAPALDGFFVMAYDMNDPVTPSATAPLVGGGYNDTEALHQFTAVVPAAKVILGVPYYGYDWPTTDGSQGAHSTGPDAPLSYGVIASGNNPTYWDPATQTAWTSYKVGTQWHQTYFDDPTSLALKAQLANSFHVRGMGIWALGMDGNDPAMLAALLGQAPAAKDFAPGPTATTTPSTSTAPPASTTAPPTSAAPPTSTTAPAYVTTGTWQGHSFALTPVATRSTLFLLGTLTAFKTNDPHLACLQTGPALQVFSNPVNPNLYTVVANQPQDCVSGTWTFPITALSSGTAGAATTTTTTAPNLLGIPLIKPSS